MIKIVVDLMGADNSPQELVKGAIKAANENKDLYLYLCGPKAEIEAELNASINETEFSDFNNFIFCTIDKYLFSFSNFDLSIL